MKLEDTIKYRLYRNNIPQITEVYNNYDFVIECKGEWGKPVPLCIPVDAFTNGNALVYKKLYLINPGQERTTPRSLYNVLFSGYYPMHGVVQLRIKESIYYYSPGVLFDANKVPLFYFAYTTDDAEHKRPVLYLTPKLLYDATVTGNPMERFFMSTIVPYLVYHDICGVNRTNHSYRTVIEIDNQVNNTFFIPECGMVNHTPVCQLNDRLNDILADNADVLSSFVENYREM